jgi:predicted dehydrogenase
MNRRHAAKAILGGVAAASRGRIVGANDRIGFALIGSGSRGRQVMAAILASGRAELRSICDVYDVQRSRAKALLVKSGDTVHECTAHEDAIARPDIDAVVVATPDHLHADQAVTALRAGKHVYLEKPSTHRFEEGKLVENAAKASGAVLQSGLQQRSGAHYLRAKEEIFSRKRLGRVTKVRSYWSDLPWQARRIDARPKPPGLDWERFLGSAPRRPYEWIRYDAWRYFRDYQNGLLADVFVHWADVAQWMMDETNPISAAVSGGIYAMHNGRENPDTVSAILDYATGWNLRFESAVVCVNHQRPGIVFIGSEGSLEISRARYVFSPNKGKPETVEAGGLLEVAHTAGFLEAIRNGLRARTALSTGIEACNPVHLANAAYAKHAGVTWPELTRS